MGGGLFDSPRPFFIPVVVKHCFSLPTLGGFNSWFLFSWFLFQPATIAILRPEGKDCLALEAGLREDSQSLPQPVPLKVTAGAVS